MKSLIGLLCLLSALFAPRARASEEFVLNAAVSATECKPVGGIESCETSFEAGKNISVALSECGTIGSGWESCSGVWDGTRNLNGTDILVRISVVKTTYHSINGEGPAEYAVTASLKIDGTNWRNLHVTTINNPSLTDTIQIDGEGAANRGLGTLTPGLTIGPALVSK